MAYNKRSNKSKAKTSRNGKFAKSNSKGFKYGDAPSDAKDYINSKITGTNEFGWYNKCGNLIEDSAKVNFYSVLGNDYPITDAGHIDSGGGLVPVTKSSKAVPGIMVFDTITTPGYASDAHSPFNLAAIQMYEDERSKLNKLNPSYAAPDLGILMAAFDDIYNQYINIVRLFGLLNSWDANSKYTPQALIRGLYNIKPAHFHEALSNKANLIARFNTLLRYARQFVYYPEDYSITARHAWLFGKVFRDHDTMKSQLYGYRKVNYYKWDETKYETGSALVYHDYYSDDPEDPRDMTVNYYLDCFEECLDAVRNSTSINDMVSDLRNAYQDRSMIGFADMTDDYMIVPDARDDHALMQIENLMVCEAMKIASGKDITQDPDNNLIVYRPYITSAGDPTIYQMTQGFAQFHQYINLHDDNLGIEAVTEATRGKFLYAENSDLADDAIEIMPNADIVMSINVLSDPTADFVELHQFSFVDDSTEAINVIEDWYKYMAFDWCPFLYRFRFDEELGMVNQNIICEWDRYAHIGVPNAANTFMKQLNRVCMLSLWNIPALGK